MATSSSEAVSFSSPAGTLRGLWTARGRPSSVVALAHGAGAGMGHPFMEGVAGGLVAGGAAALRFDFPYLSRGRRAPDKPAVLIDAWRGALDEAARRSNGVPVAAGGKSLGGRMASLLAAEQGERFPARALVFFGYPLHAPGKANQPRDSHLHSIQVPMLFMEGTQDPFATFDLVEALVERLGRRARLFVIEGGDHSFRVRGRRRADEDIGLELGEAAAAFVREVAS